MQVRICEECRKPAEPPLRICVVRLPEELWSYARERGIPIEREYVICRECVQRLETEKELVEDLEREIRAGNICPLCCEPLDPPGGTTIWSYDRKRLIRLCRQCKEQVERDRQARGQG